MQIYKIINLVNNKIYIGKDTESNVKYMGSGVLIKRAIKKYGLDNFKKEILEVCETKEELSNREKYWISFFNSTDKIIGYNISKGGDGGDTIRNNPNREAIIEKLSKIRKGKKYEDFLPEDKVIEYKKKLSIKSSMRLKGKTLEELYGIEKAKEIKQKLSLSRKKIEPSLKKIKVKLTIEEIENRRLQALKNRLKNISDLIILKRIYFYYKKKDKLCFLEKAMGNETLNLIIQNLKEPFKHSDATKQNLSQIKLKKFIEEKNKVCDFLRKNLDKTIFEYYKDKKRSAVMSTKQKFLKHSFSHYLSEEEKNLIKKINKLKPTFSKSQIINMSEKFGKKIMVEGVEYIGVSEAARILKMDRGTLRFRLKNKKFENYYYL